MPFERDVFSGDAEICNFHPAKTSSCGRLLHIHIVNCLKAYREGTVPKPIQAKAPMEESEEMSSNAVVKKAKITLRRSMRERLQQVSGGSVAEQCSSSRATVGNILVG